MAFLTKDTWGDAFLILRGSDGQPGALWVSRWLSSPPMPNCWVRGLLP